MLVCCHEVYTQGMFILYSSRFDIILIISVYFAYGYH